MYIIETLRAVLPAERVEVIQALYEKNRRFFAREHPEIDRVLEGTECPFQIQLTSDFLTLFDERTGEMCVPAELDRYAELLGGVAHEGWVELQNFDTPVPPEKYCLHRSAIERFQQGISQAFPQWLDRYDSGRVILQDSSSGVKNSPPVVFLGIFHGLQIAAYLNRTRLQKALLIEPEIERFEVSLYFLDYEELHRQVKHCRIALGRNIDEELTGFLPYGTVTATVWLRVLPAYRSKGLENMLRTMILRQKLYWNMYIPLDVEYESLRAEAANLRAGLPVLSREPRLSYEAQIAVVASGPSLQQDLEWLRRHRDNLIVFAVHSAVSPLDRAGIRPDFQFALEAHNASNIVRLIRFLEDVPLVVSVSAEKELTTCVANSLLVAEEGGTRMARYTHVLADTQPSTGNFAVALALFLKPKRLYLLGLDCGFKREGHIHVPGAYQHEGSIDSQDSSAGMQCYPVKPNFRESGDAIVTIPFYNETRTIIERCLANKGNTTIYNLSDGAFIAGAVPVRSGTLETSQYARREEDIREILNAFQPARQSVNWWPLDRPGKATLERFRSGLLKNLTLGTYSWSGFSERLDAAIFQTLSAQDQGGDSRDSRPNCYVRLVIDLLLAWYRCALFCHNDNEGEVVHRNGLRLFKKALLSLRWPETGCENDAEG